MHELMCDLLPNNLRVGGGVRLELISRLANCSLLSWVVGLRGHYRPPAFVCVCDIFYSKKCFKCGGGMDLKNYRMRSLLAGTWSSLYYILWCIFEHFHNKNF